jgi:mannose-6-phosphate isomerase-like protein (cupin superfamily)
MLLALRLLPLVVGPAVPPGGPVSGRQHFRFADAPLVGQVAHEGRGEVLAARMLERRGAAGADFLDLVVVPPGAGVGVHTHGDDEETYVIIDGEGTMHLDGAEFAVGPGDVVVNKPGGTHGLDNTGAGPLRLVVLDVLTGSRTSSSQPGAGP